jgi:hypothetical protein
MSSKSFLPNPRRFTQCFAHENFHLCKSSRRRKGFLGFAHRSAPSRFASGATRAYTQRSHSRGNPVSQNVFGSGRRSVVRCRQWHYKSILSAFPVAFGWWACRSCLGVNHTCSDQCLSHIILLSYDRNAYRAELGSQGLQSWLLLQYTSWERHLVFQLTNDLGVGPNKDITNCGNKISPDLLCYLNEWTGVLAW